ncbi:hypothetical protein DAERI_080109 [Deinococcus aerius]|uniref:Metal dependent phosphohydrolase n=1 Tax=Deinococcus aerius TaxID=200253 RepID=A0A2I9DJ54_9DEIO|nr:HD domain-containing phosphohydrolase [Deinococcus aerius]GBF06318.1 hypothetical protein DAERI_080109 [Deinococcus aerius]
MTTDIPGQTHPETLILAQQIVTRTLVATRASQEVIDLILQQVARTLGAHSSSVSVLDPAANTLCPAGASGYTPEALERWQALPVTPGTPVTDAVLTRQPVFLSGAEWDEQYPHLAAVRLPVMRAVAALPLISGGSVLGAVTLSWDGERALSGVEWAFLEGVASQCAQTLDRIRLHGERQSRAARDRKLLEYSSDILIVLDRDAAVTSLSSSVGLTLGYTEADLRETRLRDVLHPEDLPELRAQFARAIAAPNQPLRSTLRVRHQQGGWVWLEVVGRNLLADPAVRGFVCNARDVTQNMRAMQALRESEREQHAHAQRYQRLLDLMTALHSEENPGELIRAALDHGLAVTEYDQAYYYDVEDGAVSLRFARGEGAAEALALLPPFRHLRDLGKAGAAVLRHDLFFAEVGVPVMTPPEPLPRRAWRSFCAIPVVIAGELRGVFVFVSSGEALAEVNTRRLMRRLADQVNVLLERSWHVQRLDASREETLRAVGLALEYRDHETKGHTDRVVELTERLARALGCEERDRDALRWGAYLHDAGKVATPDAILLKAGRLDPDEWEVMKRHAQVGYEMLRQIPSLPPETLAVVLHHHERWNGSGYPHGLSGTDIPLPARIFAVVDVYDALTSERPYKQAWTHEEAAAQLEREAGVLLDPSIVRVFLRVVNGPRRDGPWPAEVTA